MRQRFAPTGLDKSLFGTYAQARKAVAVRSPPRDQGKQLPVEFGSFGGQTQEAGYL
jgi:hypothetical protein